MNRTRTRSAAAAVAAALLLAPLAGCGGDDDGAEPSSVISEIAGASATADGAEVAIDDFVDRLSSAMKDQPSVHMSIDGGSAVTLEADVRYGADPAIALQTQIAGTKVAMIVIDGNLYLQQGSGAYSRIKKDDPTYGSLFGTFDNFGPRGSVDDLKKGITKVVQAGTTNEGGVELTRYDVTVDTSKATGSFSQLAGATGDVEKVLTLGFLLDKDGLVQQISVDAAGQPIAMKFTDWGKPVDIEAPSGAALAD